MTNSDQKNPAPDAPGLRSSSAEEAKPDSRFLHEQALPLIEDLYAATDDPTGWPDRVERLADALRFAGAWIETGERRTAGSNEPGRRPRERVVVDLPAGGRVVFAVGTDQEPDLALLEEVRGHLVRAIGLSARLESHAAESRALSAVLERLAAPLVLIDHDGCVWRANASARELIDEVIALSGEPGSPLCRRQVDDRRLTAATAAASRPDARRLGRVTLRRDDGEPLDLLVVRLDLGEPGCAAAFAVFLVDRRSDATPAAVLASTYDLTPREADLVAQVLDGCGVAEAAERLGVSKETARSHLKRVFAKLGTTRQIDLVRLLLLGAGRVRL